ncbi:MAG: hypothetical protein ABI685_08930 [Ferruginibacter sp.]
MNRNMIMKTDILDIVFEKRNKNYGAYTLRKFYPNRIKLALGFMFIIAIVFSAFTALPEKDKRVIARPYEIPRTELKKVDDKPKEIPKKPDAPKPVAKPELKATPVNQKQYTNHMAIVPDKEKTDSIATLLPTDVIGKTNIVVANPGTPLVPAVPEPVVGIPAVATPAVDRTSPMDIDAVDVVPAYPGGMDALKEFLERNLRNPYDQENGATVNVRVKFVVGYNGKLQRFETDLDGGEAYNKEVVRVLRKMPDWQPGKAKGENVSVYYVIPVKFVMSN